MDDEQVPSKHRSTSEHRLRSVTIGAVEPLNGSITLAPYDPQWPAQYAVLEAQIRKALGRLALTIEHVGSTSVPGLVAKPIIDVVLAVPNSADEAAYVPALERLGHGLKIRESDWFEHRLVKTCGNAGNIHVLSQGCPEIDRMLAFRDWLRIDERDRRLYERTKRDLASRRWTYTQDYADAKNDVVKEILGRALAVRQQSRSQRRP